MDNVIIYAILKIWNLIVGLKVRLAHNGEFKSWFYFEIPLGKKVTTLPIIVTA